MQHSEKKHSDKLPNTNVRKGARIFVYPNAESEYSPMPNIHLLRDCLGRPLDYMPARWTRRLSKEIGMQPKEFVEALLCALNDDSIKKALVDIMVEGVSEPVSQQVTSSLTNQITALKKELRERDATIAEMQQHIEDLTAESDRLEQYTRRNSLRIAGVAEVTGEDITASVLNVINDQLKLSPPLALTEVDRIHRVGNPKKKTPNPMQDAARHSNAQPPPAPRPILVKLATYRARKRIMDLRGSLKNSTRGIFLSEDLTRKRSELLYKARVLKRAGRINGAWSADGNILILDPANKVVTIKQETDLRVY